MHLSADGAGALSTGVTPLAAGSVSLLATANGGTTPAAGAAVQMIAVGASLAVCNGGTSCVVSADASGIVASAVTPSAAETVTLSAAAGGGSVTAAFAAAPTPVDAAQAISVPANGSYVGRAAGIPFTVQVMLAGTSIPAAGTSVTLTTSNRTLGACGSVACVLTANPAGQVSTSVTPGFPGPVILTGAEGGGFVSVTFNAVPVPADVVQVVSVPADGAVVGSRAPCPSGCGCCLEIPALRPPAPA